MSFDKDLIFIILVLNMILIGITLVEVKEKEYYMEFPAGTVIYTEGDIIFNNTETREFLEKNLCSETGRFYHDFDYSKDKYIDYWNDMWAECEFGEKNYEAVRKEYGVD